MKSIYLEEVISQAEALAVVQGKSAHPLHPQGQIALARRSSPSLVTVARDDRGLRQDGEPTPHTSRRPPEPRRLVPHKRLPVSNSASQNYAAARRGKRTTARRLQRRSSRRRSRSSRCSTKATTAPESGTVLRHSRKRVRST